MARQQERWLSHAGARLYTQSVGAGEPIVVVHGGPGAGHAYLRPGLSQLADEFRTVFYDQRDAGPSTALGAATLTAHLDDLDAVLDVQEVERCVLVGHSWGGVLALLYAARAPQRVAAAALVNVVSVEPLARWDFADVVMDRLESAAFARYCEELNGEPEREGQPSRRERLEFARATWGLFHRTELAPLLPYFAVGGPERESVWVEAADAIACAELGSVPILVVQGEHDPTTLDSAARIARRVSSEVETMSLPECAHMTPLEAPLALDAVLRSFARKHLAVFGAKFQLAAASG